MIVVLRALCNYLPRWLVRTLWFVLTVGTFLLALGIAIAGNANGLIAGIATGYAVFGGTASIVATGAFLVVAEEDQEGLFMWGYVVPKEARRMTGFIERSEQYRKRKETPPAALIAEMERELGIVKGDVA